MPKPSAPLIEAFNKSKKILFTVDNNKGLITKQKNRSNNSDAVYTNHNLKALKQLVLNPRAIPEYTAILSICNALEILTKYDNRLITPAVMDALFIAKVAADDFASIFITFDLSNHSSTNSLYWSYNQQTFSKLIDLAKADQFCINGVPPRDQRYIIYPEFVRTPAILHKPILSCINRLFIEVLANNDRRMINRRNLSVCLRSGRQTKVVYYLLQHLFTVHRRPFNQSMFDFLMSMDLSAAHNDPHRCHQIAEAINMLILMHVPLTRENFIALWSSPVPVDCAVQLQRQAMRDGLIVVAPINMGNNLHDAETTPWDVIRQNLLSRQLSVSNFFDSGVRAREYDGRGDGGGAHAMDAIHTAQEAAKILKVFIDKAKRMSPKELDSVITSIITSVANLPVDVPQIQEAYNPVYDRPSRRKCKFSVDRILRDNELDPKGGMRARALLIGCWLYLKNPACPANEAEMNAFLNSLANYVGKVEESDAGGYDLSTSLCYSIGVYKNDPEMQDFSGLDPMCYARLRNLATAILAIDTARKPGKDGVIRRMIPVAVPKQLAQVLPKAGNHKIKQVSDAVRIINRLISVAKTIKYNQPTKEALNSLLESFFVNAEERALLNVLLEGTNITVDHIFEAVAKYIPQIPELKQQYGLPAGCSAQQPPNNIRLLEKIAEFERRLDLLLNMPIGTSPQAGTIETTVDPTSEFRPDGVLAGPPVLTRYQPPTLQHPVAAGYPPTFAYLGIDPRFYNAP